MKLNEKTRQAIAAYKLYSQDDKRGDAIATARLYITGTPATFYILEANLQTGELFGVSNMEKHGDGRAFWSYGYYYLPELEELELYGGLLHLEADADFTPTALRDIAEVVPDLADNWECRTDTCAAYAAGTCPFENKGDCPQIKKYNATKGE